MSSPFAPQLGTNYCPKDEEVLEIKALLVEPSLRLKRLDDEITDLQKAIDKLAEERNSLGAYVDAHKALISPVRRLPLDIIQEIFIACLPTHSNCVVSAIEAPVLLGRICSSWRAISLSTPRLWARLHLVEPPGLSEAATLPEAKRAQRLEMAKTWLGRSGQCPLSISLYSAPDSFSGPPTSTDRLLGALIPFAPRWQHISLTVPPFMLDTISHLTETDVPMLESVGFNHEYLFHARMVPLQDFHMLHSSRIRSFSSSGRNFLEKLPLQWHQLTGLEIGGPVWETPMTSEKILAIISMCPELRRCKLEVNDGNDFELTSPPLIVEFKFLHTLELGCETMSSLTRLLDRLSLPELRDFILRGRADEDEGPSLAHFLALWTRLESLDIDSRSFSKSSLLDSLRNLPPTLQRLSIRDLPHHLPTPLDPSLDDDAVAVLTPEPGIPASSCPALETLIMDCRHISEAAVLRFITARMADQSHNTLKCVKIQFNRKMTLDILPSLQQFIETGLDVTITYLPPFAPFSPWHGLPDASTRLPPIW